MSETTILDLRYPIGRPSLAGEVSAEALQAAIEDLAALPEELAKALEGLDDAQLDTPYREGGWTVRQLVHHIADSHLNAYVRVRLALTEDNPTVTDYDENAWAEMADAKAAPVEWSLSLLTGLHARWVAMLKGLGPDQWRRTFVHPASGTRALDKTTLIYGWHSRHHVAHIMGLRMRNGW